MKEKFARFMYGRYGMDKLGYMILIVSMVITLISSLFFKNGVIVAYALIIWEVYRFFSKNISKRTNENSKYYSIIRSLKKKYALSKNKLRDRKTHRYFSCTTCHNTLRVPKGKGEIKVTCPVCKTITITKT